MPGWRPGRGRCAANQPFRLDGVTLAGDRRGAVMHLGAVQALPGLPMTVRYDLHVERRRWRMQVTGDAQVAMGSRCGVRLRCNRATMDA